MEININELLGLSEPIQRIERKKGCNLLEFPRDFTLIDIETTGLDPAYSEIIEVSGLKIKNNAVVDSFSSLVQPEPYFWIADESDEDVPEIFRKGEFAFSFVSSFITELTGITNEMLLTAPSKDDILPAFLSFIGDDIIVGHNVNFDINFIYDYLFENKEEHFTNNFVDTMRLSRYLLPSMQHHRLKDLVKHFNINVEKAHRALDDCNATLACYNKLVLEAESQYGSTEDFTIAIKKRRGSRSSVKAKDIIADDLNFDEDNPLFNKVCVITGTLEKILRKDAMQIIANIGGINADGITKKTDYLILGNLDYSTNVRNGKSNKLRKAEELILKGQDITIISENNFYELIGI